LISVPVMAAPVALDEFFNLLLFHLLLKEKLHENVSGK
jgi:hypothetical protein